MPSWTMPGPTRYENLLAHGASAVPGYFRSTERAREDLHAGAAAMLLVDATANQWLRMTEIGHATGVWLDAHARDRGVRRQAGEGDDELRVRLRTIDDAVTPPALLAIANAVLSAAGVVGSAEIVELPLDGAFMGTSTAAIRCCMDRGRRMFLTGKPLIIVVLPAGTPAPVVAAVSDAIRLAKAGGVFHLVEPS
jgi:hypothetical protein